MQILVDASIFSMYDMNSRTAVKSNVCRFVEYRIVLYIAAGVRSPTSRTGNVPPRGETRIVIAPNAALNVSPFTQKLFYSILITE
jgi:hypothetical protein